MRGPFLVGERIRLRPHEPEDASVFVAYFSDPQVTQFLARRDVPSLEEEQKWLQGKAVDPNSIGWTIEFEGQPVGVVGLDIDWQNATATVGTFIGEKSLWGQGIATEMGLLVAGYVFGELPLRKIKSGYIDENVASGRLQASAGLVEVGRWRAEHFRNGKWCDHVLTELMREDWEKLSSDS